MPALPVAVFIVFLVLKLLGKIDWSWWWVTSPLWVAALLIALWVAGIVAAAFRAVVREVDR